MHFIIKAVSTYRKAYGEPPCLSQMRAFRGHQVKAFCPLCPPHQDYLEADPDHIVEPKDARTPFKEQNLDSTYT